jgi:glutamate carboxypeptidase
MKSRLLLALAASALLTATPAEAAPSRAEQAMIQTIDSEQQRTLGMLQRWVDQNSGTQNKAGVEAVRDMVEPEFKALGFKTEWIDMSAVNRAGHLIARHAGSKHGKRLLLIAHLDTVFEADSPFQRWVREGDKAHGPGAADDKGGIAVIVAALRAMKAAGTLKNANITVFLTGDEEDAGSPRSVSRRDLVAEGKKADVALDFENLSVLEGRTWVRSLGEARAAGPSPCRARAPIRPAGARPTSAMAPSTSWRASSTSSGASFPRTS